MFFKRHNVCGDIPLVVETVVALDHQVLACGPAHREDACEPRHTNKMYDHKMKDRLSNESHSMCALGMLTIIMKLIFKQQSFT